MPNGEWSLGELGRRMEHLEGQYAQDHNELREDMKWTRRFLLGTVGVAVLASVVSNILGGKP